MRTSQQAPIEIIKTWFWVKQMPEIQRELFMQQLNLGESVRMAREMSETLYEDFLADKLPMAVNYN